MVYSGELTKREQAQNCSTTCKTKKTLLPKENAATSAKVNGAKLDKKQDISCAHSSAKRRPNAMTSYAKDAHKRVAKAIGYALTLGTSDAWNGLLIILVARLSEKERVSLAWAALSSCTDDQAYRIADSILYPKGDAA